MTLKEEMYKDIQDLANSYRKSIPSNVKSVNNYLVDKIYNSSALNIILVHLTYIEL